MKRILSIVMMMALGCGRSIPMPPIETVEDLAALAKYMPANPQSAEMAALKGLSEVAAGNVAGYGPSSGPFSFEAFYDGEETSYYFGKPVREVHVTLAIKGSCTVYTSRTDRSGRVYTAEIPMHDDGDGMSWSYSYRPAMVYEVECTSPPTYFRADGD